MEPHSTCVAFVWPRPLRPEAKRRFPVAAGLSLCLSLALSAAFRTAKRRKRTSGGRLARFSNPAAPRVESTTTMAWLDARGRGGHSCVGALGRISYLSCGPGLARAAAVVDRLWFSMPGRGRKANVPCSDWAQPTGRLARGPSWRGAPNQQPPALRLERERVGRPSR